MAAFDSDCPCTDKELFPESTTRMLSGELGMSDMLSVCCSLASLMRLIAVGIYYRTVDLLNRRTNQLKPSMNL